MIGQFSTIYEWYANGKGVPVLVVSTQAGIINEMKYLDQLHVSNSEKEMVNFLTYPNPVVDFMFLESNIKKPAFITIYNVEGIVVEQMKYKEIIPLSYLKAGLYLLKINSGNNTAIKEFIKL